MDPEGEYLRIPRDYASWLGGLRWSRSGDAIEDGDGNTFALLPQIVLFLEGFGSQPPHFAHVLHLLHLLGLGKQTVPPEACVVAEAFKEMGFPLRNAGALCASLWGDLPVAAGPLDVKQTCKLLWSSTLMADLAIRLSLRESFRTLGSGEQPPLGPSALERRFLMALTSRSTQELFHWLRHGTGPEAAAAAALTKAIPPPLPRTLGQVLDELSKSERLGGAVPFVAQMVSALTLPPRRLDQPELPLGGYSDVTTRGNPEQILSSQFAVDDLEFVRRFAQNELLYFRREEPTARIREELLLILDQGVRTWGTVRLLLAAAALAFGRLAVRRKLPLHVAGTSSDGTVLEVSDASSTAVGKLIDASDLSLNPGHAVERALEQPAELLRDVVLLTHPRALAEEDVTAAARRAPSGTRLFALAVSERGEVQLSELRHGVAVKIRQFQVDLSAKAPVLMDLAQRLPESAWQGPLEPIVFPFRIGITTPIEKFAFDHEGKHLLTVSQNGMLHAWSLDGSESEVLPRGMDGGSVLKNVETVLGVAGGFVVVHRSNGRMQVLHYDVTHSTCAALPLPGDAVPRRWQYLATHHSVVARGPDWCHAVDLATNAVFTSGDPPREETSRAQQACESAQRLETAEGVFFDRERGAIGVHSEPFIPLEDGKPALKGAMVLRAQYHGTTLAAVFSRPVVRGKPVLRVFRGPDGVPLGEFPTTHESFCLSGDGRWLARQTAPTQVVVHEITRSPAPVSVTAGGRCHQDLFVEQGHRKIIVQIGNWIHLIRWDRGPLELSQAQGDREAFLQKQLGEVERRFTGRTTRLPGVSYDPARFRYSIRGEVQVVVDVFSQITILDSRGTVVAAFYVFRNLIAAWLPDGTLHGPASVIGGPSTEGALAKIGQALGEASGAAPASGAALVKIAGLIARRSESQP